MKAIETKCRKIWYEGVHLRDGWCIISGEQNAKSHHIFGRNNWPLAYNMDYGVCLSQYWHDAVEGKILKISKEDAFDKMIACIMVVDEPRAMKILKMHNGPKPKITEPDWDCVLRWVKDQYKIIESAKQWTDDIEVDLTRGYNL